MRRKNLAKFNMDSKTALSFAGGIAIGGAGWLVERRRRKAADRRAEKNKLDSKTGFMDFPTFTKEVEKLTKGTRRSTEVGRTHALAFLDLDNFKDINTLLGHIVTDEVALIPVASAIRANTRPDSDLVSRFGGDEFAIFLRDIKAVDAHRKLSELRDNINSIRPNENSSEGLGATVAYATFEQGADAAYIESLTGALSERLGQAKEIGGKNQIVYLEPAAVR